MAKPTTKKQGRPRRALAKKPHEMTEAELQKKLTAKRREWCELVGLGTPEVEAYCQVFTAKNKQVAWSESYKLKRNPVVNAYLAVMRAERRQRYQVTEQNILNALAARAFFDPRELYDEDGKLKPIKEWPDEAAMAVDGVTTHTKRQKVTRKKGDEDEEEEVVDLPSEITKITTSKREKALELMGKFLGMWDDGQPAAPSRFRDALARMPAEDLDELERHYQNKLEAVKDHRAIPGEARRED